LSAGDQGKYGKFYPGSTCVSFSGAANTNSGLSEDERRDIPEGMSYCILFPAKHKEQEESGKNTRVNAFPGFLTGLER